MMVALLIAGIGLLLAGLLTIGLGIEVDLSFGNTLILAGAVVACTGMILVALWTVVRELKKIAWQAGSGVASATATMPAVPRDPPSANAEPAAPSMSPPPWQEQSGPRDHGDAPPVLEPAEAVPAVKPRRNLLFASSSRKERERAEARMAETEAADPHDAPVAPPPVPEPREPPPVSFDDAWPQSERARAAEPPQRRAGARAPTTFTEANPGAIATDRYPPAARPENQPPVTVLKSGVVDGMAYSLYSDGSIEAQMPEGMMRFASIDELRSHLDQRP